MKLNEDGKYYFDIEPKKELEGEFVNKIISDLIENNDTNIHIENISGKDFYFELEAQGTYIYTDPNNKTEISNTPPEIEFKTTNKTEKRYIFSIAQFKKTIKYFGINFPWSNDLILNEDNLVQLIYHNIVINKQVTIEDVNIFEKYIFDTNENENINFHEIKKNIKTLKDLSIYINYYIKNNLDLFKYEEKEFINENDYKINIDSEFKIYDLLERMSFITFLEKRIDKEWN